METLLQDVDGFCNARADAECNDLVLSKCQLTDKNACKKARATRCLKDQPQGTTYVAANAAACVNAAKTMYADAKITADEVRLVDAACGASLYSGPKKVRESCTSPYDCSSIDGLTCIIKVTETQGECLQPQAVALGEDCSGEADTCPDDGYCDNGSKTCSARPDVGQICDKVLAPCKIGLTCPPSNMFEQGRCGSGAAPGKPCSQDEECDGMCVRATHQAQGTCASAIELSPLDETCNDFK
jgi:hypothetical protein